MRSTQQRLILSCGQNLPPFFIHNPGLNTEHPVQRTMQAATTQTSTSHLPLFQPRWKYEGEAIAFPESKPPFLGDIAKHADFDAGKHLAYVPPKFIYDYRFQPHEFATLDRSKFCGLGMTEPFQLLSPEGVAVARKLVLDNKHNKCFKSELKGRQPFRLRGLGCGFTWRGPRTRTGRTSTVTD